MSVVRRPWQFRLQCDLAQGETVCVVGSAAELGSWQLEGAVELCPEATPKAAGTAQGQCLSTPATGQTNGAAAAENGAPTATADPKTNGSVYCGTVSLSTAEEVQYRYCVCVRLGSGAERKMVVRRWETELTPRRLPASVLLDASRGETLDTFGFISEELHVDRGWLNEEVVVQIKLWKTPIFLWKRQHTKCRVKVTPVDLTRKLLEEEDSQVHTNGDQRVSTGPLVEISALTDGVTAFTPQEQFGREYSVGDFFTFQCQILRPDTVAYTVDVYTSPGPGQGEPEHVGVSHILPESLKETIGTLVLPIYNASLQLVGQLTVDYLVVRPMSDVSCGMEACLSRYWSDTWRGLDVGHRGAGNSFSHKPQVCANIRENTLGSMKQAIDHGADMLEFDVHLSKDRVPLIYHDFHIAIAPQHKTSEGGHQILPVSIKDLEHQQLQQLQTYHLEENELGSAHMRNDSLEENQPFPTLELLFKLLDPHVAFNVEIKWTMQLEDGTFELDHPMELNSYLDTILRMVLTHSGDRHVVFSCFHPDVCTILRLKQNRYPVLFLTQGETELWPPYLDPRTRSMNNALLFAHSAQILGVNMFSGVLLQRPEFIKRAKDQGLVVFCWGDENANADAISQLKSHGCDGVIYDRMDKYCTKQVKESIFRTEARQRSLRGAD